MQSASIALLRLATLALRFGLTIYLTAMVGLEAVGYLGIVLGLASLLPALLGLGLSYRMFHDLAQGAPNETVPVMRERMVFSAQAVLGCALVALAMHAVILGMPGPLLLLACLVLVLETIGQDLYLALSGLSLNVAGNLSVAVRSALWVPVAVGLGLLFPALRNLETVLACWAVGSALNLLIVAAVLVRRGWHRHWIDEPRTRWVRRRLGDGLKVWPSDLALVAIMFADRFVLAPQVDDRTLGIYVFFWTFANAVQTLIHTSMTTPALPRFVRLWAADPAAWIVSVRALARPVAGLAVAASVVMMAGIWVGHAFIPALAFPWDPLLAGLIFLAAALRVIGEVFTIALNSSGRTSIYAGLNMAYAVTTVLGLAAGGAVAGVTGAAAANCAAAALFLALRAAVAARIVRSS